MDKKTRNIIITAIAIVLSIVIIQFLTTTVVFAGQSFPVHGILLNLILILCTLICGPAYGSTLAIVIPVIDYLLVSSTYLNAIFLLPIMLGNLALILIAWALNRTKYNQSILPIGLVIAAFFRSWFIPFLIGLLPKIIPELNNSVSLKIALKHYNFNSLIMPILYAVFLILIIWPIVKMVFKKL